MIASDNSSDDEIGMSMRRSPTPEDDEDTETQREIKLEGTKDKFKSNESRLRKAIKENEGSIIQIILSPSSISTLYVNETCEDERFIWYKPRAIETSRKSETTTLARDTMSLLLEYLFEHGHLTRIEFDKVEKAQGCNSAAEQVQLLLSILDSKDEAALEILVECLNRIDPKSEATRKLLANVSDKSYSCEKAEYLSTIPSPLRAISRVGLQLRYNSDPRVCHSHEFTLSFVTGDGSKSHQDFYYGVAYKSSRVWTASHGNGKDGEGSERKRGNQQQMNSTSQDAADLKDFFLTNGCLETVRNLILNLGRESLIAPSWEKVLQNMNGLLSTDVLSIKDLLFQIKSLDNQALLEEEIRVAKLVRRIWRERKKLLLREAHVQEKETREQCKDELEHEILRMRNNMEILEQNNSSGGAEPKNKTIQDADINWSQVVYHSLQVWKQRNSINATFYSLIGIFQHSSMFQTADMLLGHKKTIQSREHEADIVEHGSSIAADVRRSSSAGVSTMLEKSDFLRKFYTPPSSRRIDGGSPVKKNLKSVNLSTSRDRVSVSPVLSLDLS